MTTLSELFPQASSLGGGMTKDPRHLPVYNAPTVQVFDNTTYIAASAVGFWNEVALVGAFATGSTDDAYKEVVNITGSGVLFHVISQAMTNTTDDVTFRITVDGTEYVIAKTQTWSSAGSDAHRVVMGCCVDFATIAKYTTNPAYLYDFAGALDSVAAFSKNTGLSTTMIPPSEIMNNSMPCLRFDESLVVEVKVADVYVAGTYGAYAGATYILD